MRTKCLNQSDNLSVPLPEITTEITIRDLNNIDEKAKASAHTEVNQKQQTAFQFYEQNGFGALTSHESYKVGNWIDDLSEELVIHAMKLAVENNVLRWNYVEKILLDWNHKKFKTITEVEADRHRFEVQKNQRQKILIEVNHKVVKKLCLNGSMSEMRIIVKAKLIIKI